MDSAKEFLSTISHEIRTPLTSIKGFSKTILDSYDNLTDEQKKKFIKIIYEQSERLKNLVENALLAADSEKEYTTSVFKKTDINSVLKNAVEVVKINYKERKYNLKLTPNIYSKLDSDKLQQIFVNILDNASKYSTVQKEIEISTYTKENFNFITVRNYGIEIPEEFQNRVFEKFFRVQNYLTSSTQGSGLGLYITRVLTEKNGGEVFVNCGTFGGENIPYTEFTLKFPVYSAEEFIRGVKNV